MDWCDNCKRAVDPIHYTTPPHDYNREYHGHRCPFCGCETEEAKQCECGEWRDPSEHSCAECKDIITDAITEAVKKLSAKGYTEADAKYAIGWYL